MTVSDDPLLDSAESAREVRVSRPAFWKGVREGRFPQPYYVLPRAPRWRQSELRLAVQKNRMLPAEAKLARRASKLNSDNRKHPLQLKPPDPLAESGGADTRNLHTDIM